MMNMKFNYRGPTEFSTDADDIYDLDEMDDTEIQYPRRGLSDTEIERMNQDFYDLEAQLREDMDYENGF